jgi:tetratricopeptide (TPR) repeat protein
MHEQAGAPAPEAPAPWHNTLTLQLPFVGRKKILAGLKLALQRGGVELIWGEAGAGKSRLTFEFYQSLEPAPRLLFAAAYSHLMTMPYQPLVDLIRHAVTIDEWQRLDAVWAGTLSTLLPELPTLRPGSHRPKDVPAANQTQVVAEAFLQLFTLLARRQRLLFFLDDAQWSDAQTFQVLAYLLDHKLFAERGLLVIAARPEETNPGLSGFLSQSQVPWMVHHTTLELLNRDEVAELARLALGKPAHNQLVERLARDTGGNPLFLLETLRALLDFHIDPAQPQQFEHLPLASSIHALVRERLRLLDPQARHAVATAAVIGNTFNLELFQTTAQLTQAQTVTVLEELERAHLVQPVQVDGSAASYRFIHDKIREVLLFELSQARRQFLHLRAAQAMESKSGEVHAYAAEIARHFEEAGEMSFAFQYWLQAGEYARNRQKRLDAHIAFQHAESILTKIELQLPATLIYQLYSSWGEMACNTYDSDQAEYCFAAMLRYGEQRYAPLLIGNAYSGLARVAGMRNHPRLALSHLDHALTYLRDSENPYDRIEASRRRAEYLNQLLRYQESATTIEGVLDLDQDLRDDRTRLAFAEALVQLGLNYLLLGEPATARATVNRALEIGQHLYRAAFPARALAILATTDYLMADFDQALRTVEKALQLAEDLQDGRLLAYIYSVRGNVYFQTGMLDKAWQDVDNIFDLTGGGPFDEMVARAYCLRGDIWRVLRDYPSAIESYQAGLDASQDHISSMEILFRLGLAFALNGQIEKGSSFLNQAIELCRETNLEFVRLPAELTQVVLYLLKGQSEFAQKLIDNLAGQVKQRGLHLFSPFSTWVAGMTLVASDPQEARRHALDLLKISANMNIPWYELSALDILSLLEQEGDGLGLQQLLEKFAANQSPHIQNEKLQPVFAALCEKIRVQTLSTSS